MGRDRSPKCKQCRREGMKLMIKGTKCVSPACPMTKRPYAPGIHGKAMKKKTSYGVQLREKQKVKRMYGLYEKQFRMLYDEATNSKGVTGRLMLQYLERRLDNVVYRLLFSMSRNQARQMVRHGLVKVNGKRVDIPSYRVDVNDKIEIAAKDHFVELVKSNLTITSKDRSVASWLFLDKDSLKGEVLRNPEKEDIGLPVDEQVIVELYSK